MLIEVYREKPAIDLRMNLEGMPLTRYSFLLIPGLGFPPMT